MHGVRCRWRKPVFPSYSSCQVPGAASQPIRALVIKVLSQDDRQAWNNGCSSFSTTLGSRKAAENRLAKAVADSGGTETRQGSKGGSSSRDEERMREQKKYMKNAVRQEKEIAEATESQAQARELVRQAGLGEIGSTGDGGSEEPDEWNPALGPSTPACRTGRAFDAPGWTCTSCNSCRVGPLGVLPYGCGCCEPWLWTFGCIAFDLSPLRRARDDMDVKVVGLPPIEPLRKGWKSWRRWRRWWMGWQNNDRSITRQR